MNLQTISDIQELTLDSFCALCVTYRMQNGLVTLQKNEPERVRYIKLGSGGSWSQRAFADQKIYFGAEMIPANLCLEEDWQKVADILKTTTDSTQSASEGLRQTKAFYDPAKTLWVTSANGYVWWTLSSGVAGPTGIQEKNEPAHYRSCDRPWSNESVSGRPLLSRNISSSLTKTFAYRRTICGVEASDYLLRLINDQLDPIQAEAIEILDTQIEITKRLISRLHQTDLETLTDLIFSRNGWQRTSVLGKQIPDVDLIAEQRVTGDTAWVQVKMRSNRSELEDYLSRFEADGSCSDFFYICFEGLKDLSDEEQENIHLWTSSKLAKQAIDAGLYNWLVEQV